MKKLIDIDALLDQGQDNLRTSHMEADAKKIGTLRGGSVGCILTDDGDMSSGYDIVGSCPREVVARYLGYNELHSKSTHIMFSLGIANEDIWSDLLKASGVNFKREEELGLEWQIDGVKASGRPDIVICDEEDNAQLGLELKMVASVWTARTVLFEMKPKMAHLIQAANYSYRMNVPFELWYTSYVNLAGPDFITKLVPKRGERHSEWIDYTLGHMKVSSRNKTGKPTLHKIKVFNGDTDKSNEFLAHKYGVDASGFKHVRPFRVGYELMWSKGNDSRTYLSWRSKGSTEWVNTFITQEGIDQYYQLIVDCAKNRTIPPTSTAYDAYGKKEKFKVTDYSTIHEGFIAADGDFAKWENGIRKAGWIDLHELKEGEKK